MALLLGLALRLPGWFTADEKQRFQLFEPDEMQHVDIALHRFQELSADSLDHTFTEIFNVRGYGIFSGTVAYGWSNLSGKIPSIHDVVLLNRQLSTLYALLLIYVIYLLGRGFGLSKKEAGIGAVFLALCDLNCTYSHYGIPASGYVLGVYLAILGGQRWWHGQRFGLLWLALGAAISFAFKFDFIPLVLGGALLLYKVYKGGHLADEPLGGDFKVANPTGAATLNDAPSEPATKINQQARSRVWSTKQKNWLSIPLSVALFLLFFGLITGFSWSLDSISSAWKTLRSVNENVIIRDQHWLENPLVYVAAVTAGIGLPALVLAVTGLIRLPFRKLLQHPDLCLLLTIILAEFLIRWSIDTPFVRRANVFMPAIALAAAFACRKLRLKKPIIGGILAYTLLLAILGQSNHWFDTRVAARDWMNTQIPAAATVVSTPYVAVKGLRKTKQFSPAMDWDYAIIHEAYYHRYTLSMTTPFGYPDCCEEVYHCQGEALCSTLQSMVNGSSKEAELIARFQTRNWLPERWLYHHFFGNYETFLGDILIYRSI